jgi:hypothetical protein
MSATTFSNISFLFVFQIKKPIGNCPFTLSNVSAGAKKFSQAWLENGL